MERGQVACGLPFLSVQPRLRLDKKVNGEVAISKTSNSPSHSLYPVKISPFLLDRDSEKDLKNGLFLKSQP